MANRWPTVFIHIPKKFELGDTATALVAGELQQVMWLCEDTLLVDGDQWEIVNHFEYVQPNGKEVHQFQLR
jgi:hypothetical protein